MCLPRAAMETRGRSLTVSSDRQSWLMPVEYATVNNIDCRDVVVVETCRASTSSVVAMVGLR